MLFPTRIHKPHLILLIFLILRKRASVFLYEFPKPLLNLRRRLATRALERLIKCHFLKSFGILDTPYAMGQHTVLVQEAASAVCWKWVSLMKILKMSTFHHVHSVRNTACTGALLVFQDLPVLWGECMSGVGQSTPVDPAL
jgi:hypothetical protein